MVDGECNVKVHLLQMSSLTSDSKIELHTVGSGAGEGSESLPELTSSHLADVTRGGISSVRSSTPTCKGDWTGENRLLPTS